MLRYSPYSWGPIWEGVSMVSLALNRGGGSLKHYVFKKKFLPCDNNLGAAPALTASSFMYMSGEDILLLHFYVLLNDTGAFDVARRSFV